MKLVSFALFVCLLACNNTEKKEADAIYFNGRFITLDEQTKDATVMVIKDGKILDMGDKSLREKYICPKDKQIDLKEQYVYPGLIDAHCHFYGYAKTLMSCNLVGTKNWHQVLLRVDSFSKTKDSEWILGRGWDQNDWQDKKYPDNIGLNMLFPNRPVILKRIDGHAAICNQKALDLAGITKDSKIEGGEIIIENNRLTGVLVDNAVDLVEKIVLAPGSGTMAAALKQAEKECFGYGLTTLADAGLSLKECLYLDSLEQKKDLSIYLYLMLNPTQEALAFAKNKGIYETDHCRIGSFKLYADGALGSRGARLKHDYCDRAGHAGMFLHSTSYYDAFVKEVFETDYQLNTHCIGDSANRFMLDLYGKYLKGGNDRRWRIEHAQILDTNDLSLFKKFSIVPSVQPTHASSDAPWVEDRLCAGRMKGAYAYKTLLAQNGYLPLGTDFPVEYINPLFTFYSAVFRKNANAQDQPAFLPSERLSTLEALKGMTIWAAKACKLEHRKGTLSIGKDADFVVMDKDLLSATEDEVLKTTVLFTYRMGKAVYLKP